MRRHIDEHSPNLNSSGNRLFNSNSSLSLNSVTLSNSSGRAAAEEGRTARTVDVESRVGGAGISIPVTTAAAAGPGTSSLLSSSSSSSSAAAAASLSSLHHPNRTFNTPLSPGPAIGSSKPLQRQPLALIQETVHSVGSAPASGEMQSSIQFSLPSGYQSRVAQAATTLSQASHGHNQTPSALHHPHSGQLQAHSAQVIHPNQMNSQANVGQMPGSGHQMQFQRLKVEDALSYLDQVKYKFGNQPQVYNDFLDIMKEFKSQSIDTPGVIQRVSTLFKGHPELIVGFNTFLPPGYRIEVQSNEQVQVSIPGTNLGSGSGGTGPTSLTINPGGTITTQPLHSSHGNQPNHLSHSNSPHHSSSNVGSKAVNHQPPVANSQIHIKSEPNQNQHNFNQSSPAHTHSSGASPGVHSPNSAPQANQPVEFNHAINYVNKIKNRFQGQPDIYKQFLEILHTYQKEQRNLKDGVHTNTKPLTEAEVYAQVAKLFQNQEDLLQEFGQFLPDANGANALVSLQPPKAVNNDHPVPVKKPVVQGKPITPTSTSQSKPSPAIKRPAPTAPSPPSKKPKMTSLKDVSLAEAGKYGTLNEFAFFDKVRKALKSQEAYENLLRLLYLYNQEIISRADLVLLIAPFLSKYPELFKWFKDFLGYKEVANNVDTVPNKVPATQERERVIGDFATEIDYSSCKKYGASYRAVPRNYVQPKCSGRTALCRDVLNDTWVSFPSWSEDSTFVSSRKTQYEEYIYRCEDERFELDILLDSTLSTIQTLQTVQEKMSRMSAEEKAKYRLDDNLGGSSTVIHQRNIKRIYGDKAPDVIEGLKKNPVTAVPLVLKRLKYKEEEWRKAQKSFNKIWREQNEKYYLKSLDHQGISFKQNDVKYLRSKNLLNEIENISEERHEQAEDGEVSTEPHIIGIYKNKEILKDAANLIIHHVKRQTGMHKEDKHKIKQLMRQFIPDLFAVPRGEMSDDEIDNDDMMEIDEENENSKSCFQESSSTKRNTKVNTNISSPAYNCNDTSSQDSCNPDKSSFEGQASSNSHILENCLPGESYVLFFVNSNWYIFFRLHSLLCERLCRIYDRSQVLIAEELKDREERKKSTAIALRLKPKNNVAVEAYYPTFLDMIKSLLDQNIDANQYEDTLREMFGIEAYLGYTLEKVVQNVVRQLQHLVADEMCTQCTSLFVEEQKNKATGGLCSTAATRAAAEAVYQKRAERCMSEENYYYRVIVYKNEGKLTMDLLDTESDQSEEHCENDRWSGCFDDCQIAEEHLLNEIKARFKKSPLFLLRSVRQWKQNSRSQEKDKGNQDNASSPNYGAESELDSKIDLSRLEDSTAGEAVKGLVGLNANAEKRARTPDDSANGFRTECRFNVNSFKMIFVVHSEGVLCKRLCLLRARQSHKAVSLKLNKRFHRWHDDWVKNNVSEEDISKCQNWFLGQADDGKTTTCVRVEDLSKPPYASYNHYRVQEKT